MDKLHLRFASVVLSLFLAGAILTASVWLVERVRASEFYNKSRLISMFFSQDSIGVVDVAGNRRNIEMVLKFAGALTSAYIDFELIPVGEFDTFAAVFQSIQPGITIEKFEYHRKNLAVQGLAASQEEYEAFLLALRETEQFDGVSGNYYLTTEDAIRFDVECASRSVPVQLSLPVASVGMPPSLFPDKKA